MPVGQQWVKITRGTDLCLRQPAECVAHKHNLCTRTTVQVLYDIIFRDNYFGIVIVRFVTETKGQHFGTGS